MYNQFHHQLLSFQAEPGIIVNKQKCRLVTTQSTWNSPVNKWSTCAMQWRKKALLEIELICAFTNSMTNGSAKDYAARVRLYHVLKIRQKNEPLKWWNCVVDEWLPDESDNSYYGLLYHAYGCFDLVGYFQARIDTGILSVCRFYFISVVHLLLMSHRWIMQFFRSPISSIFQKVPKLFAVTRHLFKRECCKSKWSCVQFPWFVNYLMDLPPQTPPHYSQVTN